MFKHVFNSTQITKDYILNNIGEEFILQYYFNIYELPILINSPLRVDNNASFSLFMNNNRIYYRDFGTGDRGDLFNLLQSLWNIPFKEVLNKIYNDYINNTNIGSITTKHIHKKTLVRTNSDIQVKLREWKSYDIEYWELYGISLEWLKFGNVYPISHIFIIKDDIRVIPADKYAYVYVENKDNKVTLKIYQPFSKCLKWLSKHDASVWDLWTKLPDKGDKVIITSSRKDALCLWANTGIPSVSLQGEGYIPKDKVIKELADRFINIYVLFDNDFNSPINHGHLFANGLIDKYNMLNIKMIEIPKTFNSKDPSDLVKNHNKDTLKQLIYEQTDY